MANYRVLPTINYRRWIYWSLRQHERDNLNWLIGSNFMIKLYLPHLISRLPVWQIYQFYAMKSIFELRISQQPFGFAFLWHMSYEWNLNAFHLRTSNEQQHMNRPKICHMQVTIIHNLPRLILIYLRGDNISTWSCKNEKSK